MLHTLVTILLERYTSDTISKAIPRTPNSNPLNGSKLKKPLIPKIPANPKAQEEQAGTRMLLINPDNPNPSL